MDQADLKSALASTDKIYFSSKFKDNCVRRDHITGVFLNQWMQVLLYYLACYVSLILKYASGKELNLIQDDWIKLDATQDGFLRSLCAQKVSDLQHFRGLKRKRRPPKWQLIRDVFNAKFTESSYDLVDLRRHINIKSDHVFASRTGERLATCELAHVVKTLAGVDGFTVTEVRKRAETFFRMKGAQQVSQLTRSNRPVTELEMISAKMRYSPYSSYSTVVSKSNCTT